MLQDLSTGLYYRDQGDLGIIAEQKTWKPLLKCAPIEGTVLDLGGHIGAFAWWAHQHFTNVKVVSVEPDPNNLEYLHANRQRTRDEIIDAVVDRNPGMTKLYLGKTYPACNSTFPFRGRKAIDVRAVSFSSLLKKYEPTLIKCDIEGAEYWLDWDQLPACVTEVAFEFHYQRPEWLREQIQIDEALLRAGFHHVRPPANKITFTKACIAVYSRKVDQ